MYIDVALIDDFQKKYPNTFISDIEKIIDECGIWYPTIDSVRAEWEDFEASLEEICSTYYFIIDKNKFRFVSPLTFWSDVEEYLNG